MFRRYPFTFTLGFAVILSILASWLFVLLAFIVNWDHPGAATDAVASVATFFGRFASFIPSLLWTHNPSDPHSMMPFWYRPLAFGQGFIIGRLLDFIYQHARSQQPKEG